MTLSSPIPAVRSDPGGLGAWSSGGRSGRDNRACGSSGVAARFRVPRSPFNVSRRGKGIGQLAPPVKVNWRFALGSMHYALTTRVGPITWVTGHGGEAPWNRAKLGQTPPFRFQLNRIVETQGVRRRQRVGFVRPSLHQIRLNTAPNILKCRGFAAKVSRSCGALPLAWSHHFRFA